MTILSALAWLVLWPFMAIWKLLRLDKLSFRGGLHGRHDDGETRW